MNFGGNHPAGLIEVENEHHLTIETSHRQDQAADIFSPIGKERGFSLYQPFQPGSFPNLRMRVWCDAVPTNNAMITKNVGALFITI